MQSSLAHIHCRDEANLKLSSRPLPLPLLCLDNEHVSLNPPPGSSFSGACWDSFVWELKQARKYISCCPQGTDVRRESPIKAMGCMLPPPPFKEEMECGEWLTLPDTSVKGQSMSLHPVCLALKAILLLHCVEEALSPLTWQSTRCLMKTVLYSFKVDSMHSEAKLSI